MRRPHIVPGDGEHVRLHVVFDAPFIGGTAVGKLTAVHARTHDKFPQPYAVEWNNNGKSALPLTILTIPYTHTHQRDQQRRGAASLLRYNTVTRLRLAQSKRYKQANKQMTGSFPFPLFPGRPYLAQAARAEKRALLRELGRAREAEAVMKAEADVHAIQLEAVLTVKKALSTEVRGVLLRWCAISAVVLAIDCRRHT